MESRLWIFVLDTREASSQAPHAADLAVRAAQRAHTALARGEDVFCPNVFLNRARCKNIEQELDTLRRELPQAAARAGSDMRIARHVLRSLTGPSTCPLRRGLTKALRAAHHTQRHFGHMLKTLDRCLEKTIAAVTTLPDSSTQELAHSAKADALLLSSDTAIASDLDSGTPARLNAHA